MRYSFETHTRKANNRYKFYGYKNHRCLQTQHRTEAPAVRHSKHKPRASCHIILDIDDIRTTHLSFP